MYQNHSKDQTVPFVNTKTLSFNGYPLVQRVTCDYNKTFSLYSEQNIMIFVLEGTLKIRFADTTYEVGKDKMAFVRRNTHIEMERSTGHHGPDVAEYIQFTVTNDLVKQFARLATIKSSKKTDLFPIVVASTEKELKCFINSIEPYMEQHEKADANIVKLKMLELLFCITGMQTGMINYLLDIKDYFRSNITATIEENINNSISVHQLAKLSGRSISSFRRDFMAIYNMPPSQWMRIKKLEKSKELLLGTTMTVSEVCYVAGFESIAHFSKLFKSRFGCPPSGLRMNTACVNGERHS